MRRAVLAGSFDPITKGHMDVLRRGLALFDEIVVAIGNNPRKRYLLDLETRVGILRACTEDMPQVRVDSFDGLLVEYCREVGANAILRGLRAVSDFEFEFQIGLANKTMAPEVETVFLMTASENILCPRLSSRRSRSMGGTSTPMCPSLFSSLSRPRSRVGRDLRRATGASGLDGGRASAEHHAP